MDERSALFANVFAIPPTTPRAWSWPIGWTNTTSPSWEGSCAGVIASRFHNDPLIDDPDYYAALGAIAAVTTSGAPARWLSELGIGPAPLTRGTGCGTTRPTG